MNYFNKFVLFAYFLSVALFNCEAKEIISIPSKENGVGGEFSISINISELHDKEGNITFKLRIHNNSTDVIYLVKPLAEMGSLSFLTKTKDREDYGTSSTISTQVGFDGWVMRADDEMEIVIKARVTESRELLIQGSDQTLTFSGERIVIAADALIRASNFRSKKCDAFRVKSNFLTIEYK